MTSNKAFKSRVRARMDKTGERYTTARRQLHRASEASAQAVSAQAVSAQAVAEQETAAIAAMKVSEEAVREQTGRGWQEWFALLDEWGGMERSHTETARWVATTHEVRAWWAQSITVTYQQARGLRVPGQQSDGRFTAGASKTVALPLARLFDYFADESLRRQWLADAPITVRGATAGKSWRAEWTEDATRVVASFVAKGPAKTQVAITHERIADAATAAQRKAYWRARLAALTALPPE